MKFTKKEIEKFNKEIEFGEKCLAHKKYETMIFNLLDKYVKPIEDNKLVEFMQVLKFIEVIKQETNYFDDLAGVYTEILNMEEYMDLLKNNCVDVWDCFLPAFSKNILKVKKHIGAQNFEDLLWFWNGDTWNTFWDIKSFKKVFKEYLERIRYLESIGK